MNADKNITNTIIMGFALLASILGAGNLASPPGIGLVAGREWSSALLGFAPSGILLPVLAFAATARLGETDVGIASDMGKTFSIFFTSVVMLCAGLLIAIPGTAATVHELGVVSVLGSVPQILTSCVFFAVVYYLSSPKNPLKIVETVGKRLVPVFVILTVVIVVKGVFYPLDIPVDTGIPRIFAFHSGVIDGYRTLGIFGGLIFSGVVYGATVSRRPDNRLAWFMMTYGAVFVAGLCLLFIYGGLIYLGATGSDLFDVSISNAALLTAITEKLFKDFGPPVLAFAAVFGCLGAAVGLTAGISHFFSSVTKGNLSYRACVVMTCVVSLLISALDVNAVTRRVMPILVFIYPTAVVLVVLNVLRCRVINRGTFLGAGYGVLVVGFLETFTTIGIKESIETYIRILPLVVYGFAWAVPAIICGVLGTLLYHIHVIIRG